MKGKLATLLVVGCISLGIAAIGIGTFVSHSGTETGHAFDTGQVIGVIFWIFVGVFCLSKANKLLRKK